MLEAVDRTVEATATDDIAWLGRHLARTKLGLALGAGGAKGYAHVGMLRVLERAGYTVDCVAGSSIGAIVGALIGLGQDSDGDRGDDAPELHRGERRRDLQALVRGHVQRAQGDDGAAPRADPGEVLRGPPAAARRDDGRPRRPRGDRDRRRTSVVRAPRRDLGGRAVPALRERRPAARRRDRPRAGADGRRARARRRHRRLRESDQPLGPPGVARRRLGARGAEGARLADARDAARGDGSGAARLERAPRRPRRRRRSRRSSARARGATSTSRISSSTPAARLPSRHCPRCRPWPSHNCPAPRRKEVLHGA